ncbi:MAG TPA: MmgE/PrpD family protein [Candidatus Angelobacter sp.]|jgi:2-methylcitrate dehydratase PrpD|nr:MmgE/PrpD family protein [Candidatus Angelobacter sp.]
MNAITSIANFIATSSVPEAALVPARNAFVDTIGVTLAGAVEPAARIVQKLAVSERSAHHCPILGTELRTSATWASLANGTAAHALDFDDMCFVSLAHPSAPLVTAAIAVAEELGASGRAMLEAYVLGFEVEAVLGRVMNPRHYQQGWHCTSTLGSIGAAAACARLLRLDTVATANCIALAASQASGLKENFGTMSKPLHAGLAARNGVLAAKLAQNGFTASERALDGPQGFLLAMASERNNLPETCASLGKRWEILETGITVKLYPSCAATHPALDAVLDLRRENQLTAENVQAVEVEVDSVTPNLLIYAQPKTGLEGKFSMNFCVAAALSEGRVGLKTFEDDYVCSSHIQELLPRIIMRMNPNLGKNVPALTQAIVTIRLANGETLRREANGARGYPERPPSAEELGTKFRSCALKALPEEMVESVLACLHGLENLGDVQTLTAQLMVEKSVAADHQS